MNLEFDLELEEVQTQRELRRKQGQVARRFRMSAVLMLVVGFSVAAGWLLIASPYLTVESVSVRGLNELSAESVVAASGVKFGTPLALVREADVAAGVSSLDRVAEVQMVRGWPKEIVIEIVERNPVATTVIGEEVFLVDDQGVAYRGRLFGLPLPRVQAVDEKARKAAVGVAQGLPEWIARQVAQTRASTPDDVTLKMRDGSSVIWGSTDRMDEKIDVLRVLLRMSSPIYDVSAPDVPTVRSSGS